MHLIVELGETLKIDLIHPFILLMKLLRHRFRELNFSPLVSPVTENIFWIFSFRVVLNLYTLPGCSHEGTCICWNLSSNLIFGKI